MAGTEVSMSSKRYTEEFKVQAVRQVTQEKHKVAEVAARLGITTHSLYQWIQKFGSPATKQSDAPDAAEVRRLKAEVRRLTEERDILACCRFRGHHPKLILPDSRTPPG